jgi:hypothetical protein
MYNKKSTKNKLFVVVALLGLTASTCSKEDPNDVCSTAYELKEGDDNFIQQNIDKDRDTYKGVKMLYSASEEVYYAFEHYHWRDGSWFYYYDCLGQSVKIDNPEEYQSKIIN